MAKSAGKRQLPEKVVDDTISLTRPRRRAKLREEVWQTADGEVTKYNLAYINHLVCQVDIGRVTDYRSLAETFEAEVREV